MKRLLLLALAAACPGWGQFELYLVNGNIEQPLGRAYDLGGVEPGASITTPFRIRNISTSTATLDLLAVRGTGFAFGKTPAVPVVLPPAQAFDFTVVFQAAGSGAFSAALESVGISVILSASVLPELTCQVIASSSAQPCTSAPIDFGTLVLGASSSRDIVLLNQTHTPLIAPVPSVSGAGFSLVVSTAGGTLVPPGGSVTFQIQFAPAADGVLAGTLSLDSRAYSLTGTGVDPPLPQPRISITLPRAESAEQGTVAIHLSAAAQSGGAGTVTLGFVPIANAPADPAIAFASGGQSAAFTVGAGDTEGHFGSGLAMPFQTGTTAGTLTVSVQLGANTDQQSIAIAPAAVGFDAARGTRLAGSVEIDLTGFDNTRSAGALSFTFFDASGNPIGAPVPADGSDAFASYYRNSAGGAFALKAVFPVVGNASQIAAFQAVLTNSAGTAATLRVNF